MTREDLRSIGRIGAEGVIRRYTWQDGGLRLRLQPALRAERCGPARRRPHRLASSHQLQSQFAANNPGRTLKAFDGRTAVFRIEQAVDLRAAGFH
jgi:hypothetical protein